MKIKPYSFFITLLLTIFLFSCSKKEEKKDDEKKPPTETKKTDESKEESKADPETDKYAFFETEKVKLANKIESEIVYGKVKSSNNYSVIPMNQGKITKLFVKNGDYIKVGQRIASIENKITNAELSQLKIDNESNLSEIQRTKQAFDSNKKLYDTGIIPKQDYDNALFNYEQAKSRDKSNRAKIKTIETQLSYNDINAENSGYIINLLPLGSLVGNGNMPLTNIVSEPSNIEFVIPFSLKVKSGEKLYVDNKPYTIKNIYADPTANNRIANVVLAGKTFDNG